MKGKARIPQELIEGIGVLIDRQHFNRLPMELKMHWETYVQETIAQGDTQWWFVRQELILSGLKNCSGLTL